MTEFIYVALSGIACLLIISYSTWFFVVRKAKDSPARSFWQWLKHIFEGVMGL
jgi:hypothetical protein